MTNSTTSIIPWEPIEKKIYTIRGLRVMLDSDLAGVYGVTTTRLNEQVTRNLQRFPDTFMFQLTQEEHMDLISQNATSRLQTGIDKEKWGGKRKLPRVFTERGVLMVANILKSDRAIEVSIQIIEAFVRLRLMILNSPDLAKKLEEIEARLAGHDIEFKAFHEIILPLLIVNNPPRRKAGFNPDKDGGK